MRARFDQLPTPLAGLMVLQRIPFVDDRGYLERLFCVDELQALIPDRAIVQINHSLTTHRGTVRGLHYQYPPHTEIKLVSCLRGAVFDVAVDLRAHSPTFLYWHAERLSDDNHRTLLIPEGFAHGFQALSDDCQLLYFHSTAYKPEAEVGLNPSDPRLGIRWPLPMSGISPRDAALAFISADFAGFTP